MAEAKALLQDAHETLRAAFGPDFEPVSEAAFYLTLARLPEALSHEALGAVEQRLHEARSLQSKIHRMTDSADGSVQHTEYQLGPTCYSLFLSRLVPNLGRRNLALRRPGCLLMCRSLGVAAAGAMRPGSFWACPCQPKT